MRHSTRGKCSKAPRFQVARSMAGPGPRRAAYAAVMQELQASRALDSRVTSLAQHARGDIALEEPALDLSVLDSMVLEFVSAEQLVEVPTSLMSAHTVVQLQYFAVAHRS